MIKKLIIPLIILCFCIGSAYAFRLPGMRKYENAVESNQKIEESEVSSQRDYSRSRKASVNKKPWLSENLFDMEYTVWPEAPDRSTPDLDQNGTDFRYYISECGLITDAGVNCGETLLVDLWYLRPGSIITGYESDGPMSVKYGGAHAFTAKIYENAEDGTRLTFRINTISDTEAQDAALAAAIAQQTGLPVTEADLRNPDNELITYYLNKGCECSAYVSCDECECVGATPTIVASASTIAPGGSITLYVDSGGLACPPYSWETDDIAYSITSETDNDLEEATLSASSGSCGGTYDNDNIVVTVTVTDNCGLTDTIKIRNTEGDWGGYVYDAGMCSFLSGATVTTSVSGDKEYSLEWKVGSNDGECNDSLPGCGTYSHSYAACVDYYENNSEYDIIPGHSPGELYGKNLFSTCYSCVGHRSALNITYCRHRTWECVP
jgi:hypothetical protein